MCDLKELPDCSLLLGKSGINLTSKAMLLLLSDCSYSLIVIRNNSVL